MKKIYKTVNANETREIAFDFAKTLSPFTCIAFKGDLGAGKTCFVSGLAEGLGFDGEVSSPTFALVNEYRGGRLALFHFDMYRITSWEDLYSTGFFDYCDEGGVVAVEWSENIENALPENTVTVTINKTGETTREIILED